MNGEYDFATDPDDAREVADGIGDQAQAIEEGKLGHFPMSENPEVFNKYLMKVLDDIRGEDVDLGEKLSSEDVGIDSPDSELEVD